MKTMMLILLLAYFSPAMAGEFDSGPNTDRYVADDIAIETTPNGEIVTRLVSKRRLTAQQFWINSAYYPQGFILAFQIHDESKYSLGRPHRRQINEWQIPTNDPMSNDPLYSLIAGIRK